MRRDCGVDKNKVHMKKAKKKSLVEEREMSTVFTQVEGAATINFRRAKLRLLFELVPIVP